VDACGTTLLDILGHRLSRAGNRQLNSALRLVAHVQRIHPGDWRNYHLPKIDEGKNPKEAMRCLKRQLANVIYRHVRHDADSTPTRSRRLT
jgi:transposase